MAESTDQIIEGLYKRKKKSLLIGQQKQQTIGMIILMVVDMGLQE